MSKMDRALTFIARAGANMIVLVGVTSYFGVSVWPVVTGIVSWSAMDTLLDFALWVPESSGKK